MSGLRGIILILRADASASVDDAANIEITAAAAKETYIPVHGSFQSVAQVDENTGANYFRDELVVALKGRIYAQNLDMLAGIGPDDLIVIAEDWNGDRRVMGYATDNPLLTSGLPNLVETPVFFNAGQHVTGTEKGDRYGDDVAFISVHPWVACHAVLTNEPSNKTTD